MAVIDNQDWLFRGHSPPNSTELEVSCLLVFYLAATFQTIFKYKCYQYNKYKAMHPIVLFELFDRWWKRGGSKSRDQIRFKGKQAAKEKISITFAITNHEQNLTMGFQPSPGGLLNASTDPSSTAAIKNTVRFLPVATKLPHPITNKFACHSSESEITL